MKPFSREALSYAVLLVILFAIAAVAAFSTINFLNDHLSDVDPGVVALVISSLTLGFMLIAGAFGLWAIQFSAQAESRRRVGRFVDSMDYLRDGILAVDRKGRITGSNPATRRFTEADIGRLAPLQEVFPCLSGEDVRLLLRSPEPQEIEQSVVRSGESRIIRFRSQPSEGLSLILLSDITAMNAQRLHNRQVARLQLIGQIARGVAHDFNNLLCAISGHASLLQRLPAGSPESAGSVRTIVQSVERGSALAGHLLELARPAAFEETRKSAAETLRAAAESLRNSLSTNWDVKTSIDELPLLSMSGIQMEQAILSLGIAVADAMNAPGTIRITAGTPRSEPPFDAGAHQCAGVILIAASRGDSGLSQQEGPFRESACEPGAILSVVRSLVEEAGGALHCLQSPDGLPVYRIVLPRGSDVTASEKKAVVRSELASYVKEWSVLLAGRAASFQATDRWLRELGLKVAQVADVPSVFARIQERPDLDALILDESLIMPEPKGVLRAILKLRPATAVVVFCQGAPSTVEDLSGDVVVLPSGQDANAIVLALVEARSQAARRKGH